MKKIVSLAMSLSVLLSMGAAAIPAQALRWTECDIEGVDYVEYQFYYSRDENDEYTVPHHVYTYYIVDWQFGGYYFQTDSQEKDDFKYVVVTVSDEADLDALTETLGEPVEAPARTPVADNQIVFDIVDLDAGKGYSSLYTIVGVEKVELYKFYGLYGFHLDTDENNLATVYVKAEEGIEPTADMFPGYNIDSITKEVQDSGEERWEIKYEAVDFKTSHVAFLDLIDATDGITFAGAHLSILESASDSIAWPSRTVEPPAIQAPEPLYGDFDHNGVVNAVDASILLMYSAESGNGVFTGTFEEYVNENYPVQ